MRRAPTPTSRSPDAAVHQLLDDARFAPSGGNRQPWRVAVVKDLAIRRRMAELMQPVWDTYIARGALGITPFNSVDDQEPDAVAHAPNALLDGIESVPVVLGDRRRPAPDRADGRPVRPTRPDRRRVDLPVLLEHPAVAPATAGSVA